VVTDSSDRVIAQQFTDPVAWRSYRQQDPEAKRDTSLSLNRSLTLKHPDGSTIVVRRQALYDRSAPHADGSSRIAGYLEIGLRDPKHWEILDDFQNSTIALTALLCLIGVPLAVWWVQGWIKPLRRMVHATLHLGMDAEFHSLDIKRDDEIGMLAQSFNMMAMNLADIQQALIEANEQLERKVDQRTGQLEAANRKLEREMNEKDQFLRAVSHDLGAPLRNIAGLTSMLIQKHSGVMTEDAVNKLVRISANVRAETDLIEDLVELSRIKSHRGKVQRVDLNELTAQIAEQFSFELESKRITLSIQPMLPTMLCERNRLRQVFQNLIDNAIKYMPDHIEDRRIEIGWTRHPDGRVIFVRDTGSGVAEKDREAIFTLFRRARYSSHDHVDGRGVGLATVRAIVECYDGRIWVDSEPGAGAQFSILIGIKHMVRPDRKPVAAPAE
jgi:signal transduction histidine kinase